MGKGWGGLQNLQDEVRGIGIDNLFEKQKLSLQTSNKSQRLKIHSAPPALPASFPEVQEAEVKPWARGRTNRSLWNSDDLQLSLKLYPQRLGHLPRTVIGSIWGAE